MAFTVLTFSVISSVVAQPMICVFTQGVREGRSLKTHDAKIVKIIFTPDCKHLVSVSTDQYIRMWNLKTGKQVWQQCLNKSSFRHIGISSTVINGEPIFIRFTSNRKALVIGGANDRWAKRIDLASGKLLPCKECAERASAFWVRNCAPNGDLFVSWASDHNCYGWSLSTGKLQFRHSWPKCIASLKNAPYGRCLAFSGDGKRLALLIERSGELFNNGASVITGWDLILFRSKGLVVEHNVFIPSYEQTTFRPFGDPHWLYTFYRLQRGAISGVHFGPNDKLLAVGTLRTIRLFNLTNNKEIDSFRINGEEFHDCLFTPNGDYLFAWTWSRNIHAWDIHSRTRFKLWHNHPTEILSVAVCPKGKRIATGGADGVIRIRELKSLTKKQGEEK